MGDLHATMNYFLTEHGAKLPIDFAFWDDWTKEIMDKRHAAKFNRGMLTRGQRNTLKRFVAASQVSAAPCWVWHTQARVRRTLLNLGMLQFDVQSYGYVVTVLGQEYVRRFCQ